MNRNLSILLLFIVVRASAQQATINGTITIQEEDRISPAPFVSVMIQGTTTGANTDVDGRYLFTCAPGSYTIVASFVGLRKEERSVTLRAGETLTVNFAMTTESIEMEAAEVVRQKRTESDAAVMLEMRRSEQVLNGLGREQIGKGQDRTAGDVVKRIPGVTMVSDRFVMIRGLADRYNTVLLNDVPAPSLEADRRAFSFDILPSGVLDRVLVYKTAADELPGEFAGGVIKVYTMNAPEKDQVRFEYSTSYRSGTTGALFFSSAKSGTDALGFDNGLRQLPAGFPGSLHNLTPDRLTAAGRSLANNWGVHESTAMPDQRFNLMFTKRIGAPGGKVSGGNVSSISYGNSLLSYTARNQNYNVFDPVLQRSDRIYDYSDQESIHQVRASVMSNFSVLIGPRHKLEFRNLFTQQGIDRTTVRTGNSFEEQFEVRNYAFRYQQRTIYSGQLHGEHEFRPDLSRLSWTAGYGLALSKEPDFRRVRSVRSMNETDADAPFNVVLPPGANTSDAGRFFSDMVEKVITGKVDHEHKSIRGDRTLKLRTGVFVERKDRDFNARWMSFRAANNATFDRSLLLLPLHEVFAADNINSGTGFKLEEGTNPSDRYTAVNTLLAAYAGGTLTLATATTISAGVRAEHNTQQLNSATFGGRRVAVDNPVLSVLPSINVSRALTERAHLRAAWSTTVNRPEFRELAPFAFYDFSMNNVLRGNDSIRTATVRNVDLRYEFYPGLAEVMSVGVFYKHFTDPIEMFFLPGAGSGGTRNFTFGNAERAYSMGGEVEIRRSLNSFIKQGYLSKLGVMCNATYVFTEVVLGAGAAGQAQRRPLMGQSPYIVNAGLYYADTARGLQYNILYNVIGPRLFAVGTYGTPDIHELPRNVIDITLSKRFGERLEVKVGAQDILNERTRLVQDSNGDGRIGGPDEEVMSFRRGACYTIGAGFRF